MTDSPASEDSASESSVRCRNCGATLQGSYCHACGQRWWPERSLRYLARHAVEEAFSLDGRLARTLHLLLVRPGLLTRAYLQGRRTRFTPPLRLFIAASIVFFGVLWLTRPVRFAYMARYQADVSGETAREQVERGDVRALSFLAADHPINVALRDNLKRMADRLSVYAQQRANALSTALLFLLPVLVLVVKGLYRNRPWLDHAVFAAHFGAAFLIGFLAFMTLGVGLKALLFAIETYTGRIGGLPNLNVGLYTVFGVVLIGFLYASLRQVYGAGRWGTAWRCAVLAASSCVLYLTASFAATLIALLQV